jgi:predicted AAA+ superfamily ATPase
MEQLRLKSNHLVSGVSTSYVRTLHPEIDWEKPLVGIIGPRGVGKTTLLLQQIKLSYGVDPRALYITLDDIYLAGRSLREFTAEFRSKGGKHLFIDDIQKQPQWSLELKNIFETLPDIKITFAGSSTIEMVKHYANLTQRARIHNLSTLSFREYLGFKGVAKLPRYDLQTILSSHMDIAAEHIQQFSPNLHLDDYLTRGNYPLPTESYEDYKRQVERFVSDTIEMDMRYLEGFDSRNVYKVKQLVNIIAQNSPFKPNLVHISEEIGVHRNTLISYFFHLEKAKLINLIYPAGVNVSILQKPHRVYLSNSNLANMLSAMPPQRSIVAQNFAIQHLSALLPVTLINKNIFELDSNWHMVVSVPEQRIRKTPTGRNIYTFSDVYEVGTSSKIPLWVLGLLY